MPPSPSKGPASPPACPPEAAPSEAEPALLERPRPRGTGTRRQNGSAAGGVRASKLSEKFCSTNILVPTLADSPASREEPQLRGPATAALAAAKTGGGDRPRQEEGQKE